jgi:hypothetical protein
LMYNKNEGVHHLLCSMTVASLPCHYLKRKIRAFGI